MIKMGILSANNSESEHTGIKRKIEGFAIEDLIVSTENETERLTNKQTDELNATNYLYASKANLLYAEIRQAIRESQHLFLQQIPLLSSGELEELLRLENEAGCLTQIFVPHLFHSGNLNLVGQLSTPALIDVHLQPEKELKNQLLNTFLFFTAITKSDFKKTEIFAFPEDDHNFLLDLRLHLSSGSILRLLLSQQIDPTRSAMQIFREDRPLSSCKLGPLSEIELNTAEGNALAHFIQATRHKPAILISLNELLQAQYLLEEIQEKLKYNKSLLL